MSEANIRKWLEEVETKYGEPVEAIIVGQHDRQRHREEHEADENIILTREAGLAKLDQDYDNGYGGADCYPMYAWTKSRVFFIAEYDGATGLAHVPRNPIEGEPDFSGASS